MTSENLSDPELEKMLMQMGFLTQPQLTEALEFQARIPRSQWMPIAEVLLEMERITPQQLQQAQMALQTTASPTHYQAPDWDQVFDPLTNPKAKQTPPTSPAPAPVESVAHWDAIFDTAPQAPPVQTNTDELDLKYLFDQAQSQAPHPQATEKAQQTPPATISREPLPDLEALFNLNTPQKSVKPASNLSSLDHSGSDLDLAALFDSPTAAQSSPNNTTTSSDDLFNFPTTPPVAPTVAQTPQTSQTPQQAPPQSAQARAIPPSSQQTQQPAKPVVPPAQQAGPTAPPATPNPAPVVEQDGWTVQSAWGVPKKPFVPPAQEPEFRKPAPPPAPPPATHQLRQQELDQMMAKVMGPDAPSTQQPDKPLGEILLEEKELEEWQLTHALCMQKSDIYSKQKIGAILVKMGYVTQEEIERALKTQIKP